MKEPTGAKILETLLKLYAEQEHIRIKYKIEEKEINHEVYQTSL